MDIKKGKPIVVAGIEDFCKRNEDGTPIKDVMGKLVQDDEKWNEYRHLGIGGSSASCVSDECGNYVPARDAYGNHLSLSNELRKIEKKLPEGDKEKIFHVGHIYEEPIAEDGAVWIQQNIAGKDGLKVRLLNDTRMFKCGDTDADGNLLFPHSVGNMDRFIRFSDGRYFGVEVKTFRNAAAWTKTEENPLGIPYHYQVQAYEYMGITNIHGWFFMAKNARSMDDEVIVRFLPWNEEIVMKVLQNNERFWNEVENGKDFSDPDENGDAALFSQTKATYASPDKIEMLMPDSFESLIPAWENADEEVRQAQEILKKAQAALEEKTKKRLDVENRLGSMFKDKQGRATYVDQNGRMISVTHTVKLSARYTFDLQKMETEEPDLYKRLVKMVPCVESFSSLTGDDKLQAARYRYKEVKKDAYGNPEGMDTTVKIKYPQKKAS